METAMNYLPRRDPWNEKDRMTAISHDGTTRLVLRWFCKLLAEQSFVGS